MKKRTTGLMALALLISTQFKAITYYISPTGNDNASGTSISTPWQSITKLNSMSLPPGTVVLFEGGQTYPGNIYLDSFDGNDASNPIHISSYGNGKALIQSGTNFGFYAYNTKGIKLSRLIFEGSGLQTNTNDGVKFYTDLGGNQKLGNIQVSNVEVRQYGKVGISVASWNQNTGYKDVLIDSTHVHHIRENGIFVTAYTSQSHVGWGHQNVSIRNTEVDNITGYSDPNVHRGSGIIVSGVDKGLVDNCHAHHTGMGNTHCGGPGGIWIYDANNITVQYCESHHNSAGSGAGCDGLGFDFDGGVTNSILQYNYSHDNDGSGYLLGQYENARPWFNNTVRYNISENDARTNEGGITLFQGKNTVMHGCKIYNNTVYMTASPLNPNAAAFNYNIWYYGMDSIQVFNNIFQTTGGLPLVDVPPGYNAYFAGNLYWSSGAPFKIKHHGTTYTSLAAWRSATNNEKVGSTATGINADPLLMNVGAGVIMAPAPTFSLNAYKFYGNSPAINAAIDLSSFGINTGSSDFYKTTLPGSQRDVGAYEKPSGIATIIPAESGASIADISFSPNPLPDGEFLHIRGGESPYKVELYNINGALVSKQDQVYSEAKGISSLVLAGGIYIIRITDKKGREKSDKIIIP